MTELIRIMAGFRLETRPSSSQVENRHAQKGAQTEGRLCVVVFSPVYRRPSLRVNKDKQEQEKVFACLHQKRTKKRVRRPGIEPGSTPWKGAMLTFTPATLFFFLSCGTERHPHGNEGIHSIGECTKGLRAQNKFFLGFQLSRTNVKSPYFLRQSWPLASLSAWSYSVVVSTGGFDPPNPGSNPGRTSFFFKPKKNQTKESKKEASSRDWTSDLPLTKRLLYH